MSFAGSLAAAQLMQGGRPRSNSVAGIPRGGPLQGLCPRLQAETGYNQPGVVGHDGRLLTDPMGQSLYLDDSMVPQLKDYQYLAHVFSSSHYLQAKISEMARLVDTNDEVSVLNFWANACEVRNALVSLPSIHSMRLEALRAFNNICKIQGRGTEGVMQKLSDDLDCGITAKKVLKGIAGILCFVACLGLLSSIVTFCAPLFVLFGLLALLAAGLALWAHDSGRGDERVQDVCNYAVDKMAELNPSPAVVPQQPPQPPSDAHLAPVTTDDATPHVDPSQSQPAVEGSGLGDPNAVVVPTPPSSTTALPPQQQDAVPPLPVAPSSTEVDHPPQQ